MNLEFSRRAFVAGLCGALCLVFAPFERFIAGLGELFDRLFGREEAHYAIRTLRGRTEIRA